MRLSVLAALCALSLNAFAATTTITEYRLGEDDPGATAGAPGNALTVARTGGPDLARAGAPTYTGASPSSRLAVQFDGIDDRYSSADGAALSVTDNWGIELMVRSDGDTTGAAIVGYVGNTSTSGYGMFRNGGVYSALFGGITIFGSAPVTSAWTHLALVRASGTTTMYANGAVVGTSGAVPTVPVGVTHVGGNHLDQEYFDGAIDNVRFFTFAPGAFDPLVDLGFATLAAAPESIDFGTQRVGTSSTASIVTLSNPGMQALEITAISAPGAGFELSGGTCAAVPFTLSPGASCTLGFTFTPAAAGAATTTVTVTSDGISSPDTITLDGVGVEPLVALTPDPLQFGEQLVGTTSAPAEVTLQNTGSDTLSVSDISAPGSGFALAGGSCGVAPFTLAAGADCTLSYTFTPAAMGAASSTVSVTSDASSSPDTFALQGTGVAPVLAVTAELAFGEQAVGTTSAPGSIVLENTGTANLEVANVDAAAAPFAAAGGTCGAAPFTVAPGASCTLSYTFAPTAVGISTQALAVTSSAASSPDGFTLSGTGVQSAIALSPESLDFGSQPEDSTTEASVTLSNAGTGQLDVSAVSVPAGPFTLVGGTCGTAPFSLAAGASCTLTFAFTPTSAGAASATVSIASNAQGSPTTLLLQGGGTLVPLAQPELIPTLQAWMLMLLAGLVAVIGVAGVRRS